MTDLIWQIGGGLAALFVLALGVYRKGRGDQRRKDEIERHNRQLATKERIQDAVDEDDRGRDSGRTWVDRLRDLDGQ